MSLIEVHHPECWVSHQPARSGGAPLTNLTRVLRWNRSEPESQINGVEPPSLPRLSLWQQQQQQRQQHLTLLLLFGLSSALPLHLLHQHVRETPANTGIRSQRTPPLLHFFCRFGSRTVQVGAWCYAWHLGSTQNQMISHSIQVGVCSRCYTSSLRASDAHCLLFPWAL